MTIEPTMNEFWDNLQHLSKMKDKGELSWMGRDNYHTLLNQTRNMDEHPEEYEGHCECQLCMSNAAVE